MATHFCIGSPCWICYPAYAPKIGTQVQYEPYAKVKYWIRFTHHECPVCGRGKSYQERVYETPKPKDPSARHIYEPSYDHCMDL